MKTLTEKKSIKLILLKKINISNFIIDYLIIKIKYINI